jgi:formate hydrogenlyase subunit 4
LLIPIGSADAPISFKGDFVLFAAILGLGRFFLMLAALDTGSSFEGMGAAREATFACFAEPVLFFGMLVLASNTGKTELTGMLGISLANQWATAGPSLLLILLSWFIVMLAENCRIPFDDPNTHLELTMIHEVMVLDHSGPDLAAIQYGSAIKFYVGASMLATLLNPWAGSGGATPAAANLALCAVVAVAIGTVESLIARLKLRSVPKYIALALASAAVALLATAWRTGASQ